MEILPIQHPKAFERALNTILQEKILAFPTDTVYGVGTGVKSSRGIERLYDIKGRSHTKAIAVLLGSMDQLPLVAENFPSPAEKLARKFWPGALTLVVAKRKNLPENISPYPTIGIRIPDHEFAIKLLKYCGPLATTSANLSGEKDACSVVDVLNQLPEGLDLLLDGGVIPAGIPSTVVDCTEFPIRILRKGAISEEEIFNTLK